MKRLIAFTPFFIALVVGGFFLWGLNPDRDPNEVPTVLISQPAPDFDLSPIEGVDVPGLARANLVNSDTPVVVNVFASWCVPCRAEHAVLSKLAQKDGMRLYGINYKDKPKDAARWLNNLGNPYTRIGSDVSGRAGIEWGISGVPETFIIARDGTVVFRFVGPVVGEEATAEFRAALIQAGALKSEES
ncbi:DsbE family thiol:disulfide interchange protein [Falsihalocynthiibacter arcticus]|uniref:Disulfide bond formation protein DsbE n=1 Tax=Falsihalocynthiibacter arcticus TaxID=1579316 RepID=A0A126V500_9RHOB|nr:DsbE family thiol:disulfide interchange protein [Falsihalocynthiibacter arcticus]AML53394.1 disulfide bond formation protein DsbE [Falsihalocynthiibacter arcticus]